MTAPAGAITTHSGRTYPIQGRQVPSMSTVLATRHREGLAIWLQKRIAYAVAVDPFIRDLASDEATTYRAVRQALDTAPTVEADLGTDVHWWTEQYDRGEPIDACPAEVRPFLDHWIATREEFTLRPVLIEATVADMATGYAGTLDRTVAFDDPATAEMVHRGCELPHVLDVKTGARVYPDVALQLAGYARAPQMWDAATDTLTPKPPTCAEVGLVAALHADGCKLIPMDLTAAMPVIEAVVALYEWEQVANFVMGDPLPKLAAALPW